MAVTDEKAAEELITLDGQAGELLTKVEQCLEQGQAREEHHLQLAKEQRAENRRMKRLIDVINPGEQKVSRRRSSKNGAPTSGMSDERLNKVLAIFHKHRDRPPEDPNGVRGEVTSIEIAHALDWQSGPTSTALRILREPNEEGKRRIRVVGNRITKRGASTKAYALLDG